MEYISYRLISLLILLLLINIIHGTHLRMGSMGWTSSIGTNKQMLNLKFRLAMRRSAGWISNSNVGSRYYSGTIDWGDGKRTRAGPFQVNPGGIDKKLDFSDSTGTMSHKYSSSFLQSKIASGFYITYRICCRISNSKNNRDRPFRIWTCKFFNKSLLKSNVYIYVYTHTMLTILF